MRNKAPIFEINDLIWKALSKLCLAYCLLLLFLYFMKYEHAKDLVQVWAEPVTEEKLNASFKAWDINCDLTGQDFLGKFDSYFYSHLFGWVFHTFYLKDWWMCWCWSLLTGNFIAIKKIQRLWRSLLVVGCLFSVSAGSIVRLLMCS